MQPSTMSNLVHMDTVGNYMPSVYGTKSVNYGSNRTSGLRRNTVGSLLYIASIAAHVAACGPVREAGARGDRVSRGRHQVSLRAYDLLQAETNRFVSGNAVVLNGDKDPALPP